MKLGLLADIHEHVEQLREAISILKEHGADRFIVLGDVFEMGKRIDETVSILEEVAAEGVWGNHDIGLCFDRDAADLERYSSRVLDFMGRLQPRMEIEDCLFTHVEPWLDTNKIEDLWYVEGPPTSREKLARSFEAMSHRVMFMGHNHRWLLGTPDGPLPWQGEQPVALSRPNRYLVIVHAIWAGRCALFDTETGVLTPFVSC